MKKLFSWPATFNPKGLFTWFDKHFLQLGVGFLLFFIPLYPKFPLIDIKQTWVYIRVEDFLVAMVIGVWLIQLLRKKVSFKTSLTVPIFVYWVIGGLSVLNALFILRSQLAHFFPLLSILHYVRRIEYMALFFVAASTIKDIKIVKKYLWVIGLMLLGVCLYGFGQKFLGFPAFLTMNEEFAKGLPLYLPSTARMTSTFAGHYDLAAFLILMIAFWGSLIFGFKNLIAKLATFVLIFMAFILLLFTASRISFMVYLVSISFVLFLQHKKWLILPVIVVSIFLSQKVAVSSQRFAKTFRIQQVVYDTKTGKAIATVEDFFANITPTPTPVIITKKLVPAPAVPVVPAGTVAEKPEENLPLGSGFFNIEGLTKEEAIAQLIKRPIFISRLQTATLSAEIATESGEFLIKRAIVYDISFTTRFQAEWPNAIQAFKRNIILGSGYSSITLATDNDYLRLLGETGLMGFFSFLGILAVFSLLVKQGLREINDGFTKSLLIGTLAGILGLMLNAILIDVFEASKVAYTFWLILGIVVGLVKLALPKKENLSKEAIDVVKHPLFTMALLIVITPFVYLSSLRNYFVGDDFTWLRWSFSSGMAEIPKFFVSAQGFFYRPLIKAYFLLVNPFFGLQSYGYHLTSVLLHLGGALGALILAYLITKRKLIAFLTGLFFLIHPVNSESVLWVSSVGHLFAGFFYIWGFIGYIYWRQSTAKIKNVFLILPIVAFILGLFSHELVVTFPLMLVLYDLIFSNIPKLQWLKKAVVYLPFWIILGGYYYLRNIVAGAHGLSGDYNYNLKNLPFNIVGNLFGYLGELIVGLRFVPIYDWSRTFLRLHKLIALAVISLISFVVFKIIKKFDHKNIKIDKNFKLIIFACGWLVISLLPFIGLGNIAERYLHTAQFGFFLVLTFMMVKVFDRIKVKNTALGLVVLLIITLILSGFYLTDLEKAKKDWFQAGEIANKILLTLPSNYAEFVPETNLYFVNLPLRINRAWIFPVGLKDGIWFIYRDDSLRIYLKNNLDDTLDLVEGNPYTNHVFLYDKGELVEVRR